MRNALSRRSGAQSIWGVPEIDASNGQVGINRLGWVRAWNPQPLISRLERPLQIESIGALAF
jgi:hypothetical protein